MQSIRKRDLHREQTREIFRESLLRITLSTYQRTRVSKLPRLEDNSRRDPGSSTQSPYRTRNGTILTNKIEKNLKIYRALKRVCIRALSLR